MAKAKPKATPAAGKEGKAKAAPVPAADEPSRLKNVLALRGTDEWKEWLNGFATRKGMPVTVLVDHALRELAKREGYQDPPARVP
jgi:hypothetical protein